MKFETEGISFAPVGTATANDISLKSVKYRNMILNIKIKGNGNAIRSFSVNGNVQHEPFISAKLKGNINIEIEME